MAQRFYDHPDLSITRAEQVTVPAATAETVAAKFIAFAKMRILSVKGAVLVAGTAAGAGYSLLSGTTVVGTVVCGTGTAGAAVTGSVTPANAILAEGGQLNISTLEDSATLSVALVIEYKLEADADVG